MPEGAEAYLDFWWSQGEGTSGQHLILARATGDSVHLDAFDLDRSARGWKQLFAVSNLALTVQSMDLSLNASVHDVVKDTIRMRLENELGGTAPFEHAVQEDLEVTGQEPLDVQIVGSALVTFPASLSEAQRRAFIDSLVFAHAGARRSESTESNAAAYGTTLNQALSAAGWVGAGSSERLSRQGELLDLLSAVAGTQALFSELGLP